MEARALGAQACWAAGGGGRTAWQPPPPTPTLQPPRSPPLRLPCQLSRAAARFPGPPPWRSLLTSSTQVKALGRTKLQAGGGRFKITNEGSLKTSQSWQIKEARGLQWAWIVKSLCQRSASEMNRPRGGQRHRLLAGVRTALKIALGPFVSMSLKGICYEMPLAAPSFSQARLHREPVHLLPTGFQRPNPCRGTASTALARPREGPGLLFPTPSEDFPHTGLRSLRHPPPHRFMQRPRQGDIMMLSPVSVTFFFLDALPGCERHNRRLLWHGFSKARMEWGAARSKRPLCDCTFCSSPPHPHWRSVAMAKCVPSWEARDRGLSCGLSFVSKHCSSRCRFPHLCNDDFALNLCDSALEFLSGPACLRIPCWGEGRNMQIPGPSSDMVSEP